MSARHSNEHARPGKGSGYMSAEIVGCQFSVYPLRQTDVDGPVQAAIRAAREEGCTVRVANLSTLLSGSEDQVFAALRAAFRAAQRQGPAVMTATLASGMPTDGLVDEIQRGLDARGPSSQDATSGQGRPPDSGAALGACSRPTGAPFTVAPSAEAPPFGVLPGGASLGHEPGDDESPGSEAPADSRSRYGIRRPRTCR